MKTYRLFLLAATAVAVAACSKSNVPSGGSGEADKPVQEEVYSLDVSLPGSEEVKTFLGAYGATTPNVYDILWKTGDKVKVNGVLSNGIDAKYNGQKRANFSFSSALSAPYYVIYPGNAASGDVVTVPATQTYVEGSFDPAAAPMYASSATTVENLNMQNLTGTICLMMTGTDKITSVELNAIGGEPLAGQVTLQKKNGLYDGSFSVTSPASTITLGCGSGVQLSSTATPLYIPVLAQKYTQGFIAKLYNASGSYMQLKFWNSAAKTVSGTALYKFEEKEFLAGREDVLVQLSDMDVEGMQFDTKFVAGAYNIWTDYMRRKYYDNRNNPDSEYYSGEDDGKMVDNDPRLWDNAKMYMAEAIVDADMDVFGVCEISQVQMQQLPGLVKSRGGNFTWMFFRLDAISCQTATDTNTLTCNDDNGGCEAIVYDNTIFSEQSHGQFWLTDKDNGTKPHKGTGLVDQEGNYRMVIWAVLKHKVTGKEMLFCHCHAPLNDNLNKQAAAWIKDRILDNTAGVSAYPINPKTATGNLYPVVFVGDLNAHPNEGLMHEELCKFWNPAYQKARALGLLSQGNLDNPGTWENWRGQKSMLKNEEKQLDHIFYSNEFKILGYTSQRYTYKAAYSPASSGYRNFYPSDHVPVVAELSL